MDLPKAFDFENEPDPFLARMRKRAAKNFRVTARTPLQNAMYLAYWCHVFGRDDEALEVCAFLALIPFNGNFDLWTWLEGSLVLYARLLRQRDPDSLLATECVQRIRQAGFVDRRLEGLFIDKDLVRIKDAASMGKTWERDEREVFAVELCTIIEMGGSAALPVLEAERMFQDNLKRLRELLEVKI